jgi:hypothetical protein
VPVGNLVLLLQILFEKLTLLPGFGKGGELSEAIHAEAARFVNASKKLISSNQSYADVLNLI